MIPQLISIFLESAAQDIEKMRIAICASDATALASAAHSLKEELSNMGASALQEFCQQIEVHGRATTLGGTSKLLESLELEFGRVAQRTQCSLQKGRCTNAPGRDAGAPGQRCRKDRPPAFMAVWDTG